MARRTVEEPKPPMYLKPGQTYEEWLLSKLEQAYDQWRWACEEVQAWEDGHRTKLRKVDLLRIRDERFGEFEAFRIAYEAATQEPWTIPNTPGSTHAN